MHFAVVFCNIQRVGIICSRAHALSRRSTMKTVILGARRPHSQADVSSSLRACAAWPARLTHACADTKHLARACARHGAHATSHVGALSLMGTRVAHPNDDVRHRGNVAVRYARHGNAQHIAFEHWRRHARGVPRRHRACERGERARGARAHETGQADVGDA